MNERKHNGIIGIWKFIFAIVIMLFHSRHLYQSLNTSLFKGGYIVVEFFFIISGFYFIKNVIKEDYNKETIGKETVAFIYKKIKLFFPYVLVAYIINVGARLILFKSETVVNYVNSIWNLLLLRQFGFRAPLYSGQLWYISVMLLSMFILYPFIKKYKENFVLIVSPLIVIFMLGYMNFNKVGLDNSYKWWIGFVKSGTLRGFAEINLGMLIYLLNKKLKSIDYTKLGKILLSLLSEGLLILVLIIISVIDNFVHYDYVMLLFIIISVLIMVSEKTYEYKWLSNNTVFYLERLSLPIFINHSAVIDICYYSKLIELEPRLLTIIVVIMTIILSIIEMYLVDILKKKKVLSKCSKLIIKNVSLN